MVIKNLPFIGWVFDFFPYIFCKNSICYNSPMNDTLGKIFGSAAKVKVMRLFIFNSEGGFTVREVSVRAGLSEVVTKKEIQSLLKAEFIKKKTLVREVEKRSRMVKEKVQGYIFDEHFPFTYQFRNILMEATPLRGDVLIRRFNKAGKIKLIITSGIFIQDPESRLDLMIVGDRLNKTMLDKVVRNLESEIGRELRYAVFETVDFKYRVSVLDRLVRDVLDYPHETLLDRMNFVGE